MLRFTSRSGSTYGYVVALLKGCHWQTNRSPECKDPVHESSGQCALRIGVGCAVMRAKRVWVAGYRNTPLHKRLFIRPSSIYRSPGNTNFDWLADSVPRRSRQHLNGRLTIQVGTSFDSKIGALPGFIRRGVAVHSASFA